MVARTTDDPLRPDDPRQPTDDPNLLVDAPGSLPEHRPLREVVQRTLAPPPPSTPAAVVVGKRLEQNTGRSPSSVPAEWIIVVTVTAVLIGLLSFFRPEFVARIAGGGDATSPAVAPSAELTVARGGSVSTGAPIDGPSRIDWGDDLHHYVVTANVVAPNGAPTASGTAPSPEAPVGTATTEVVAADGTTSLRTVPDESLRLVVPTADEVLAMRALDSGGPVRPLVVVDIDGVVGAPMARYIQFDGRLIEPASPSAAPPSRAVPPVVESELIALLEARDDVARVTRLGHGLIALSTRVPAREVVSGMEGIESVSDDVLFGISALPDSAPPPQHLTTAASPPPYSGEPDRIPLVAVIDTGFAHTSSDLAGRWWSNDDTCGDGVDDDGNGFVDDCRGWDFGADDADPTPEPDDPFGDHGTELATAIAAPRNGSGVVGVADGAIIMPLKVMRPTGVVAMSGVAGAIDYAVDNGADVVTIALSSQPGIPRDDVDVLERAIARAEQAGVVVVTGAGNDGASLLLTPAWPASFASDYRNVITVGALDSNGARAPFSNHGAVVGYAAAGVSVPVGGCAAGTRWRTGSSLSAAIVSGTVALVIASSTARDLDAVLSGLVARTQLVDGVYVVDSAPSIDSISAAPGGRAPLDATCRAADL